VNTGRNGMKKIDEIISQIVLMCSIYANNKSYVYKSTKNNIIILKLFVEKSITNEKRCVKVFQSAKFRTNCAQVIRIISKINPDPTCIIQECRSYYNTSFIYKIGEIITIPDFNYNMDEVCTTGIHYFHDVVTAYMYYITIHWLISNNLYGNFITYNFDGSICQKLNVDTKGVLT